MTFSTRDSEIGQTISLLIAEPVVGLFLEKAAKRASGILANDSDKLAGTVSLDLEIFGPDLPVELLSCRLSVMRATSAYHVERHPDAIQYVYVLKNSGSISIFDGRQWNRAELSGELSVPLQSKWHVVPANSWHQPVPGPDNWVVLGFHSVPADQLVDDYEFPGPPQESL